MRFALRLSLLPLLLFTLARVCFSQQAANFPANDTVDRFLRRTNTNWSEFGFIPSGGRFNPHENVLNSGNVGTLSMYFNYYTGGAIYTSSPAVADGVVYFGSSGRDHTVYALNAKTGALLWQYTTGRPVGSSPAVANGVVYVNSYDNNVYALNAKTGGLLWKYTTGLGSESSPAVANGVVYIGSGDFDVYASWVDEASHATPVVRDNCWAAPDRQTVP